MGCILSLGVHRRGLREDPVASLTEMSPTGQGRPGREEPEHSGNNLFSNLSALCEDLLSARVLCLDLGGQGLSFLPGISEG